MWAEIQSDSSIKGQGSQENACDSRIRFVDQPCLQSRTLVEFVECTEKAAGKSASGFFQILCLFSGSRYYALADDDEAAQTEHQHQSEGDRSPGFGNRGIVIDMHFEP